MENHTWWRDGIVYQIYPRSFQDSDGDGLGDLPGIIARLDHLAGMGVDALWLSPIYPSPDKDFGYDISDYCAIDPRFGSLQDFDTLVTQAHRRGLRIVLDLVLNHTSDQHPWFQESRASRENPKRDWYLWADRPNNWQSVFGGPAWQLDPVSGQYYLHMFVKEQPDLNWRNPEVRQALLDVFRFWLERGVDGFRLDVFNMYFKDRELRSNPRKFGLRGFDRLVHRYDHSQPEMIPLLAEIRSLLDSYPGRYAVGETFGAAPSSAVGYTGPNRLHAAFSFDFTAMEIVFPWSAAWVRGQVAKRESLFGTDRWPTTVMSNHDLPRAASRYSRGEQDAQTRIAMALLLTLRGTPFLYYGEEIGMRDIHLRRDQILDPAGLPYWPFYQGRDGCRSPMQWDGSPGAGFSTGRPWLPVHPNAAKRNVAAQEKDPGSMLHFTRSLIRLRRTHAALRSGSFAFLEKQPRDVIAYLRMTQDQTVLVAMNFASGSRRLPLPAGDWQAIFPETAGEPARCNGQLELGAQEIRLLLKT
jgi:alpha-glucosidase